MPSLAVIADVHLDSSVRFASPNPRILAEARLCAFERVFPVLRERGVSDLVVAGDLFHAPVVAPWVVRRVNDAIASWPGNVCVLDGNHDTDILQSARSYVFGIADSPTWIGCCGKPQVLLVPYRPGFTAKASIEEALRSAPTGSEIKVMIGHFAITDDYSSEWEVNDSLAVPIDWLFGVCNAHGISDVIVGHYHRHSVRSAFNVSMVTVGALNPTSSAETGCMFGNIAILHIEEGRVAVDLEVGVVPGVRYSRSLAESEQLARDGCWVLYSGEEDMGDRSVIPTDVSEAFGRITARKHRGSVAPSVSIQESLANVSLFGAVTTFVDAAIDGPGLTGSASGLIKDAATRLGLVEDCEVRKLSVGNSFGLICSSMDRGLSRRLRH